MKKVCFIVILALGMFISLTAQNEVSTIQPTIMVVPNVDQGDEYDNEMLKAIQDKNYSGAISIIKDAFNQRGFETKSLEVAFQSEMARIAQTTTEGTKTSVAKNLISNSGADLIVELDLVYEKTSSGNYVIIILEAFDPITAQSKANKRGESPKFFSDDVKKLTAKAVDDCIEPFLNNLQEAFTRMLENGRSLKFYIEFAGDSEYNMDSEIGEDEMPLIVLLEDWFAENAYKGYAHMHGYDEVSMVLDDVRIPLKNDDGTNYRATNFSKNLYSYLKKTLGLKAKFPKKVPGGYKVIIQ